MLHHSSYLYRYVCLLVTVLLGVINQYELILIIWFVDPKLRLFSFGLGLCLTLFNTSYLSQGGNVLFWWIFCSAALCCVKWGFYFVSTTFESTSNGWGLCLTIPVTPPKGWMDWSVFKWSNIQNCRLILQIFVVSVVHLLKTADSDDGWIDVVACGVLCTPVTVPWNSIHRPWFFSHSVTLQSQT